MVTQARVHLFTLVLLLLVQGCQPVCVDATSETEAVLGKPMMLTCISCLKREEVKVKTRVDWYYRPRAEKDTPKIHIYMYKNDTPMEPDGPFKDRLTWIGSQDLQDVSIKIRKVTYNDSGLYECHVFRLFEFKFFSPTEYIVKNITLKVKEKAAVLAAATVATAAPFTRRTLFSDSKPSDDPTAFYSEIMMYVLLVFLTFWLLVEMVYCYRKISKSDEQAQDTATNYLAVPSEQKDNAAAPVTE